MVIINLKTIQQQFLSALDKASLIDDALGIYQRSMQGNLSSVLSATFPVCSRLVGDAFFRQLAKKYIAKTQYSRPDITFYGEGFPDFVAQASSLHALCYLADVAQLEWACHQALNGALAPVLDTQALAAVPAREQSQLIFRLAKNSRLIYSPYPILRIWQVNQVDYEGDQTVDLSEAQTYSLVHIRNQRLCLECLTEDAFKMLTYFSTGMTFETVCQRFSEEYPMLDIPRLFANCVQQGYLVDFDIKPS